MRSLDTITVLLLAAGADAGDSCCKKRLQRLIPDAAAVPPDVHEGQPRLVVDPDPANVRPESWDDEDDGPWEPEMVPNPAFAWRPPIVPNPEYTPPTLATELEEEARKAAPWVVLGVGLSALLEAAQLPVEALAGLLRCAGPLGGALLGLATPLCSCGSLPVAAAFVRDGVPLGTGTMGRDGERWGEMVDMGRDGERWGEMVKEFRSAPSSPSARCVTELSRKLRGSFAEPSCRRGRRLPHGDSVGGHRLCRDRVGLARSHRRTRAPRGLAAARRCRRRRSVTRAQRWRRRRRRRRRWRRGAHIAASSERHARSSAVNRVGFSGQRRWGRSEHGSRHLADGGGRPRALDGRVALSALAWNRLPEPRRRGVPRPSPHPPRGPRLRPAAAALRALDCLVRLCHPASGGLLRPRVRLPPLSACHQRLVAAAAAPRRRREGEGGLAVARGGAALRRRGADRHRPRPLLPGGPLWGGPARRQGGGGRRGAAAGVVCRREPVSCRGARGGGRCALARPAVARATGRRRGRALCYRRRLLRAGGKGQGGVTPLA
mmetsp:Transcript_9804/g.32128  ORF Transcript_9804/g.32128 Transcript_9804/m.32128 type:complete len:547 (-) Transcript_9804:286-1926(-)